MIAELQHISKIYEQPGTAIRNQVLDDVTLEIESNATIAIVGPSGSGKSTLLNILGTLDKPSSGKAFLEGADVSLLNDNSLADLRNSLIGFVFQNHYLLPQLTLLENVMLPMMPQKNKDVVNAASARALQLIERVGLTSHVKHLPGQMSVGECQRTAIVRALVNQPKLLLADEPTGSLDAANAGHLAELLVEINKEQNLALVIVTHSMELASKMNVIYQLREGKLKRTT